MELRFPESEIPYWAEQFLEYWFKYTEHYQLEMALTDPVLVDTVQQQGYLDLELLKKVATWKSPRRVALIDKNSESDVREITGYALKSPHEHVRWSILTELHGIGLPTASAVLHFFHEAPYPIIDFRAMWSLCMDKYNYSFKFWKEYVTRCRNYAERNNVDMRTLDRALWEYSRQNQETIG